MRNPALMADLPAAKNKFKLHDFLHLINSVNPKKALFALGIGFSLITSGASLIVVPCQ